MTEAEIKALIAKVVAEQMAEGLKTGFDEFANFFESNLKETVEPLVAKVTAFEEALTAPEGVGLDGKPLATEADGSQEQADGDGTTTTINDMKDSETKVLLERLAMLEQRDKDREAAAAKARFGAELRKSLAQHNPIGELTPVVEELLSNRYQGMVETEGKFYTAKGETLSELVDGFFSTAEGKHFQPARSRQGTGETPKAPTPPVSAPADDLDSMLKDMII